MSQSSLVKSMLSGVALCVIASSASAAEPKGFSLSAPGKAEGAEVSTPSVPVQGRLRRIAADSGETFFPGESSNREFPFFALPAEVASPATLVLSMMTAISAAPERSRMRVLVNDIDVGTVDLQSGDTKRIELPVPGGVIQPGYNSVSVLVDQKHRVDCSIDATYELWTQIDPENSGFVFAGAPASGKSSISDLIAQGRGNDGRASLVAHVLPGTATTDIDRTLSVVQALSILGDFDHPAVTFDAAAAGPGIDIYVGTYSTVREMLGADVNSAEVVDGMNIQVPVDGQRAKLIISARTADELDLHIKEFAAQAEGRDVTGTPQGLRALGNTKGQLLQPSSQVPLADLGFISKPFAGRLYRETFNFSMPSDFYPADYASLVVNLSAQYAAGLSKNAVLIVKANDQIVSNIQLGDGQTGVIKNQRLPVPLSKLRPGENTLTFEAQLPTPSDASCDPVASLQEPPRFLILDETFLEVPAYARVGRYPDIGALVSGSSVKGLNETDKPLNVYVPKLDRQLLDVAGSFIAKMAYSSGRIADVQLSASQPGIDTSGVLAFGTYSTLPQAMQSAMKLDLNNIPMSFKPLTAQTLETKTADQKTTVQQATAPTTLAGRLNGFVQSSQQSVADAIEWAAPKGPIRLGGWTIGNETGSADEEIYRPKAGSDLLIAQRETKAGGVWTVVASPDAATMATGMTALSQRATWRRLNGSIQTFSQTGMLVDQQKAGRETLFQTQAPTFTNLRLVTAGWFANNTVEYTLAQIAAALLLGISTFAMLKVGRKS